MQDGRKIPQDEVREWVREHLAKFPERDEAWRREVLNIRASGLARTRKPVAPVGEAP
ncbi:hypothetical protein AB0942_33145 [Streptomyces nodosus]|uniref:hypothetical protein n=1 Tax=Streptomyces nodosus TaxID=40318 RepID=UPI003453A8BD